MTIDLCELDGPNHDEVVKSISHVQLDLLESLKVAAHKYFAKPAERKSKYLKGVGPSPVVKYGTSFAPEKEKVLEWRDCVSMIYTNDDDALEFWPNECKEVALTYIKISTEMVKKLLRALIGNLGVKLKYSRLDALIGFRRVNMNYYPPYPNPELTVGTGRYSDIGMLTVLRQDGMGGLHVKIEENASPGNEEWNEIPPNHGALVINVGDTLHVKFHGTRKLPHTFR